MIRDPGRHAAHTDAPALARRCGEALRVGQTSAAVEGQHHVLGLRMIADVMEGAGFDVLYPGADVPVDALRRFAGEHGPSITGLGFAISVGVGVLAESIQAVHEACPGTQIMLGGRAVPAGLVEAGYTRVDNSMEVLFAERASELVDAFRPRASR